MADTEKTAAEMAADEHELAIKRGDIIPEDDDEAVEGSAEEASTGSGKAEGTAEGEGDDAGVGGDDAEGEGDEAEGESAESGAAEADAGGTEEEGKDKGITIPKARFDEAQQKSRDKIKELEAKLKQAEVAHAQQATDADIEKLQAEIDDLENVYEEHLLEGEVEKARAARKQVNAKRNTLMDKRLVQQSQKTGNAAVEQIRYETKLAILEAKYPALNPDSESYNAAIETEVSELKAAFEARGWGSTAALEKAVHYVIRETDEKTTDDPDLKRSQRAHKARKSAAAAAKATPPDTSKAGRDSDKGGKGDGLPDVTKMSPEQFAKWAESDPDAMARLRGDTLSNEEAA
jgi:hypothetical protein